MEDMEDMKAKIDAYYIKNPPDSSQKIDSISQDKIYNYVYETRKILSLLIVSTTQNSDSVTYTIKRVIELKDVICNEETLKPPIVAVDVYKEGDECKTDKVRLPNAYEKWLQKCKYIADEIRILDVRKYAKWNFKLIGKSYWLLTDEGSKKIEQIRQEIVNFPYPRSLCLVLSYDFHGTLYQVLKQTTWYNQKQSQPKRLQEIRQITVPCKKYDIAKVYYTKTLMKYCLHPLTGKVCIYEDIKTQMVDLPIEIRPLLEKLNKLKNELNNLSVEIGYAQEKLASAESRLSDVQSNMEGLISKLQLQKNKAFEQLEKAWKQREQLWTKRDKWEELNIKPLDNKIDLLNKQLLELIPTIDKIPIESDPEYTDLQDQINDLYEQKNHNPIDKDIALLDKQIDELNIAYQKAQKAYDDAWDKQLDTLQEYKKEVDKAQLALDNLENNKAKINGDIITLELEINNRKYDSNKIKLLLGLKDTNEPLHTVQYTIGSFIYLIQATLQDYESQMKIFMNSYETAKNKDKTWEHADGAKACENKCEDKLFFLGLGQSNNSAFMKQIKATVARYRNYYRAENYDSYITETSGSVNYKDLNSINSYDYPSRFYIHFKCKKKTK